MPTDGLTLGLTMISMCSSLCSTTLCMADSLIHKLLVLKILNRKAIWFEHMQESSKNTLNSLDSVFQIPATHQM